VSDVLKVDPNDPRPPYRQLADGVRAEIEAGIYAPGTKLPSYDALAEGFGVSLGVAKRAMAQLRDEQVIVIRHGQGSYVRTDRSTPETQSSVNLTGLQAEVAAMGKRLEAVERRVAEL